MTTLQVTQYDEFYDIHEVNKDGTFLIGRFDNSEEALDKVSVIFKADREAEAIRKQARQCEPIFDIKHKE